MSTEAAHLGAETAVWSPSRRLGEVASPARRWDGAGGNSVWEIRERQRKDLASRREQLDFTAKRRAAAQEAARVQKIKNLQKRMVEIDRMQALARQRNSQLLADVMDLQNDAIGKRPMASAAHVCLQDELHKFTAYVQAGKQKWAQDRAERLALRDRGAEPAAAAASRRLETPAQAEQSGKEEAKTMEPARQEQRRGEAEPDGVVIQTGQGAEEEEKERQRELARKQAEEEKRRLEEERAAAEKIKEEEATQRMHAAEERERQKEQEQERDMQAKMAAAQKMKAEEVAERERGTAIAAARAAPEAATIASVSSASEGMAGKELEQGEQEVGSERGGEKSEQKTQV